MNGHASPSSDNSNGAANINSVIGDTKHSEDNTSNKPVFTVWNGLDVVLTENRHPGESKRDSENKLHRPSEDQEAVAKRRQSWRRTSSGQQNDHGWLRQLDLRSDIPTMEEIRHWSFDVLEFEDTVLINVFIKMLDYYNLLEKFQLDRKTLERYCREVMNMHHKDCYYQKVDIETSKGAKEECKPDILCAYHNWYHAISCAHVSFLFLTIGGADAFLYPVELFCIIFGGLMHDLDHPGTNNDFQVKRSTDLAKLYNNDAVLERHSINMGLNLCQENPDLDWMKSFDEKDREYVKHFIAEIVLATDPARHGDIVKEALVITEKGPQDYRSTSPTPQGSSSSTDGQGLTYFNQRDPQHRQFIGKLILHSADISNPVHSSFEVASDWAIRVTTEFTRQATQEKQLQLPVTTYMDGLNSKYKISKMQIGFFHWMVKPLYNTIGKLFTNLKMLEDWGEKNCVEYQAVIDAIELEQEQRDNAKDKGGEGKKHGEEPKAVNMKRGASSLNSKETEEEGLASC